MAKKRFYDVWFLQANTVYKEVPYSVVTDWAEGGRLQADDRIRPSGTAQWFRLGGFPELSGFLHRDEPQPTLEEIELEPLYGGFTWKRRPEDDDDDPDMIPLIDVSLVLLVFFMMTASVATVSRILSE